MKSDKEILQAEMARVRRALNRIEDAEREAEAKTFVGKCFKYRNNYSVPTKPSDYWWLYCKVIAMRPGGTLEVFRFQTDRDGRVSIDPCELQYRCLDGGYRSITLGEYMKAWRALLKRLNGFRMVPKFPEAA